MGVGVRRPDPDAGSGTEDWYTAKAKAIANPVPGRVASFSVVHVALE